MTTWWLLALLACAPHPEAPADHAAKPGAAIVLQSPERVRPGEHTLTLTATATADALRVRASVDGKVLHEQRLTDVSEGQRITVPVTVPLRVVRPFVVIDATAASGERRTLAVPIDGVTTEVSRPAVTTDAYGRKVRTIP
jgi:hypothetical protein